jgi:hypothetical protein
MTIFQRIGRRRASRAQSIEGKDCAPRPLAAFQDALIVERDFTERALLIASYASPFFLVGDVRRDGDDRLLMLATAE